jgi:hypothetical protein
MSGVEKLHSALLHDLTTIYKKGLDPEGRPGTVPALAELARAVDGTYDWKPDYYRRAIELLLLDVFARLPYATQLFRAEAPRVEQGLTYLFGLGEDSGTKVTYRRMKAGPLLGYPDGNEGLRKAERQGSPLIDRLIEEITDWLLAVAVEENFVYRGRFIHPGTAHTPLEAVIANRPFPFGVQSVKAGRLSICLLKDLYLVCTKGLSAAAASETLEVLPKLAQHSLGIVDGQPAQADAIEEILLWASENAAEATEVAGHEANLAALRLYLDIDDPGKQAPLTDRHNLASSRLSLSDSARLFPDEIVMLLRGTRDFLLILATEADYWTVPENGNSDTALFRYWHEQSQ